MEYANIIVTVLAAVIGVAIGKAWGSYGRQTTVLCGLAQEACRGKIEEKIKALTERMNRVERFVLNSKATHE